MRSSLVIVAAFVGLGQLACASAPRAPREHGAVETSSGGKPILDEARFNDDAKCAAKDAESCTYLAWSCWKKGDSVCTLKHALNACDLGHQPGCVLAGRVHDQGGAYTDAHALYERACNGGESNGCFNLGKMYAMGHGVSVDQTRAVAEYRKGCDLRSADACGLLGVRYLKGLGVTKDEKEAARLLHESCDLGSPWGCWDLALAYERGEAMNADPAAAATTRGRACDLFRQRDAREQRVPQDITDSCATQRPASPRP